MDAPIQTTPAVTPVVQPPPPPDVQVIKPATVTVKKVRKPWLWWVFVVLSITSGTTIGAFWTITKYGKNPIPVQETLNLRTYAFTPSTKMQILPLILVDMEQAKKSVVIMASELASLNFLETLNSLFRKQRTILIILDPSQTKARNWLIQQGFHPDQVMLDVVRVHSQFIVIDKDELIFGTVPFSSRGQNEIGEVTFSKESDRVSSYFNFFKQRWEELVELKKAEKSEGN